MTTRATSAGHHKLWALAAVVLLAAALMFFGAGKKRTSVPWVLGLSEAQAEKRLENRALEAEVLKRPHGAHKLPKRYRERGHIVFQDYRRGITLPADSTVRVMIYKPKPERRR